MIVNFTDVMDCYGPTAVFNIIVVSVLFLPCVIGNALILLSIYKFSHMRSMTHILIGNLAIADLLVGISYVIIPIEYAFPKEVAQMKELCILGYGLCVVTLMSSVTSLLGMSIERFISLAYPLKYKRYFTAKTIVIGSAVLWLLHIVLGMSPVAGWNDYDKYDEVRCVSDFIWTDRYIIMVAAYITVGLLLNTIFYSMIVVIALRFAAKHKPTTNSTPGSLPKRPALKNKTKITMIVFAVFAFCWLPITMVMLIMVHDEYSYLRCIFHWLAVMGLSNSAMNWAIYGLTNQQFREAFRKILFCQCCPCSKTISKGHGGPACTPIHSVDIHMERL